jgi:hypothetical protein
MGLGELMLAAFCLRLACGLIGSLTILSPRQINPRFYRTHFLTALGLSVVALVFAWDGVWSWLEVTLGGATMLAVLGSLSWSLEESPAGRLLIWITLVVLMAALVLGESRLVVDGRPEIGFSIANGLTSAALLGTSMTAMLMGHSYLTAPATSIAPLLRLLVALGVAIVARAIVSGTALVFWTASHSLFNLEDETVLWLPVRWLLGIALPLGLGALAWNCARIRSTQSATGILYVVVIFCFLGELTSLLLLEHTGAVL